MHDPNEDHWLVVKQILWYLKGTPIHGIYIRSTSSTRLMLFSYANWGGDHIDRKSTSGFAVFYGSNIISWSTCKHAWSSTDSKYRFVVTIALEFLWIQSLLCERCQPLTLSVIIWCDNISATYLIVNPCFHSRSKHLEIDFHLVRDLISKKIIQVWHISTHDQLADVLTKALSRDKFLHFKTKLRVFNSKLEGRCKR